MKRKGGCAAAAAAAAVGLALGGLSILDADPAQAALEPAVLEAVESAEVVQVAEEIASLLEAFSADAQEGEIAAALHRYLAASLYEDGVLEDALAVVLAGTWTEVQLAALRSIFAEYAPQDIEAPGGGGEAGAVPPAPGSTLARADEDAGENSAELQAGRAQLQGFTEPPPPPSGGAGSSDYRP